MRRLAKGLTRPTLFNPAIACRPKHILELRYDVDIKVLFARSALLEHHPLTKFPETWHELPDGGSMDCLIPLSNPLQLSLDITSNNLVFTLHTFLFYVVFLVFVQITIPAYLS